MTTVRHIPALPDPPKLSKPADPVGDYIKQYWANRRAAAQAQASGNPQLAAAQKIAEQTAAHQAAGTLGQTPRRKRGSEKITSNAICDVCGKALTVTGDFMPRHNSDPGTRCPADPGAFRRTSPAAKPQANTPAVVCHPETNTPEPPDPFNGAVSFTGPRRPTHAEAAAILASKAATVVCQPETPRPDPTTAAARLDAVVAARKARTAKPRKPRNEWHQVQAVQA
jgi:hypothetical protein